MLDFINKTISKIFGSKSDKDIKEAMPLVEKTKEEFAKLASVSNDVLRNKTVDFKKRIKEYLADIDRQVEELRQQTEGNTELDPDEKEKNYKTIDQLKKDRDKKLEEVLLQILSSAQRSA